MYNKTIQEIFLINLFFLAFLVSHKRECEIFNNIFLLLTSFFQPSYIYATSMQEYLLVRFSINSAFKWGAGADTELTLGGAKFFAALCHDHLALWNQIKRLPSLPFSYIFSYFIWWGNFVETHQLLSKPNYLDNTYCLVYLSETGKVQRNMYQNKNN